MMALKNARTDSSTESQLKKILDMVRKEPTHLNYWNAYRQIERLDLSELTIPSGKKIKIALLSSFTIEPLAMYLDVGSRLVGLYPEIYVGPFNQYSQEILSESSGLYRFDPDVIVLAVHAESLLDEDFLPMFHTFSKRKKRRCQTEIIDRIRVLLSMLVTKTKSLILMNNFLVPHFSPLGILDSKAETGLREFFQELNRMLTNLYKESRQIYLVDLENLASIHGKSRLINYEMYYRGAFLFSESFLPAVAEEIMSYIKALKNIMRKCIVLDLDNVLWGGIIGEDGFERIKLGGDPTGKAYRDFQRLLLSYYNRGIILAINSKNNYDEAVRVIREHPNMILCERNFASMKINWRDKVENMIELSNELDIGLESTVFVDDSPQERERMRQALPQVLVVNLPVSPFRHCQALQAISDFNVLVMSEEDKRRGEMYYARRKRVELMQSKSSLEEFLKSLDMSIEVKYADKFSIPRITSLLNRTNQFNLTTRRYSQTEVEDMNARHDRFQIYDLRVTDRFGDEGIVGVAIVRKEEKTWNIDSFLMSCRVIGRKIETAFLAKIVKDAKMSGVSHLIGEYIPTSKNEPAQSFYEDHGFERIQEAENVTRWRLDLKAATVNVPDWVRIKNG